MDTSTRVATESAVARLRRQTVAWFLVAAVATAAVGVVASGGDSPANWLGWTAIAVAVLAVEYRLSVGRLPANHQPDAERVFPTLGVANLLTLLRGVLIAWTAGFLAFDMGWLSMPGWVAPSTVAVGAALLWAPAVCYGAAALADAVDGALARRRGRVTSLGEQLDLEYDSLGVLVAVTVGVFGGAIPTWYLSVGGARYAFLAGVRWRRSNGRPVYELPDRAITRVLAGCQMAFLVAALSPITGATAVALGCVVVGVPFLLNFLRDWMYVSGRHPRVDYSTVDRV